METIGSLFGEYIGKVKDFFSRYDVASWPGFTMFFMVVTLGVTLNYITLRSALGDGSALLVSVLFEIGILAWKFQTWRAKNSVRQYEIASLSTWLLVFLAIGMVVINLFRSTLQERGIILAVGATFDAWTIAAYSIIGFTAFVHVVGYLTFDQADLDKKQKREVNKLAQKDRNVENAIKNAETDLKIIHKIASELTKLRREYSHLPNDELEFVLEQTRNRLLKEYSASKNVASATKDMADINRDGKIGGKPQNSQHPVQQLRQIVVNAADTEQVVELPTKAAHQ